MAKTREEKLSDWANGEADPANGYVLVPGPHSPDIGEDIERGADQFTDELLERLPHGVFYRRGAIPGQLIGEAGEKTFTPIENDAARLLIDEHVRLSKWVIRGRGDSEHRQQIYVPASRDHAGLFLARAAADYRVPEIKSLTAYPIYLDGFTLSRPGYQAGVYYDAPKALDGIRPVLDVEVIRRTLTDLLIDFPFKTEADAQNYIGLLLTPGIRVAAGGNVPGHLIHASLERTGKTKLAEVAGFVWTGKRTPAMQLADSNEEMDKRLLAMLLRGETLLHLDNLKEWVDLPCLASLLTATVYQGRILGSSRIIDIPNNLSVIATGNNVRATGELVKRMVPIMLQPRSDAPELRSDFVHPDLWGYVRQQRRHVLECLLGMVERWKRAGKPRGNKPMGGFDEWAACIGGIMDVNGFDLWLSNADEWRGEADTRRSDLRALVDEWHALHGEFPIKVIEALQIAERLELFPEVINGREGKALLTSFGMKVLARNVDVPVGPWVIHRNSLSRPAVYALRPLKSEGSA